MTTPPTIPAEALENHIAVLAKTGAGKSNLAKTVVESLLDRGERCCCIDPTGTWWGLRLMPDGSPSPYKVLILGGAHADIAISARDGAAIAEVVGTSATSCIIDTRQMTVAHRTQFFTDFAERLLQTNKGRLHLIIDEAHVFAPKQKVSDPQSGKMLHAASNLISLGRGIGLSIMVLTQRPAKLHNDVLGCAETLVAMRMLLPHDKDAVSDWVKDNADPAKGREIRESLGGMETGEFWLWAPMLDILERRKAPLVRTKDTGRPLPPEEAGIELEPVAVEDITARLADVAAEVVANDPRRLKADLGQARAELARLQAEGARAVVDEGAVEAADMAGYQRGLEEGRVEARAGLLAEVVDGLTNLADDLAQGTPIAVATQRMRPAAPVPAAARAPAPPAPKPAAPPVGPADESAKAPPASVAGGAGTSAGPVEQKVLNALAELESIGVRSPQREFVAMMAGYSNITSKSVAQAFSALRSDGAIIPKEGRLELSDAGRARAEPIDTPSSPEQMRQRIIGILGPPVDRILGELVAVYPDALGRQALAERAGYTNVTSKAFAQAMSRLRDMGFIDAGRGDVRAADSLFPGA